jgi:hypothetical protein
VDVAAIEALEDAWRPESRPDIPVAAGRWGAAPYPGSLFLELLFAAMEYLRGPGRFCDLGAGAGGQVLRAADRGCPAWGVEIVPEWAEAARQAGADVTTGPAEDADLTGTDLVYLNQCYQHRARQAGLEEHVRDAMDSGAVLLAANYAAPPPAGARWHTVWHDVPRRRGVWVKPA